MNLEKPMTGDSKPDGPERVLKLLNEIFEVVAEHGGRMDDETVTESIRMTTAALSRVCRECQGQKAAAEVPPIEEKPAEPAPKNKSEKQDEEKRRLHLLRLTTCKLSNLFDTVNNPNPMNRATAHGLDTYLNRILGSAVYDHLNDQAGAILKVTGRNDVAVLNSVQSNPFHRLFLQNILVRIALSFKRYASAKRAFISDLNAVLPSTMDPVGHAEYRMILGALLFDLFIQSKSGRDSELLDYEYGPKTVKNLNAVAEQFGRDI